MEYCLEFTGTYFLGVTSGPAEAEVFASLLDEMLDHEHWTPGAAWLYDHSALDSGPLTVNDIRTIADLCAERSERLGAGRAAIVVSRDLEFGLARMWGVFVEGRWNVTAGVFRSRGEGVEWLSAGPAAP